MTDQEIAETLVDVGILRCDGNGYFLPADAPRTVIVGYSAHRTIRSWVVAGACLERMRFQNDTDGVVSIEVDLLRDPRAICEAFVESQK